MISRIINDEFGVSYHSGHVRELLDQIGFSVQRAHLGWRAHMVLREEPRVPMPSSKTRSWATTET